MGLSHLDKDGNANMVDVSNKSVTERTAIARAIVSFSSETFNKVIVGNNKKGDIISVSKIAGIMAAKNTSNLIPLCHPLNLSKVDITFKFLEETCELKITSVVTVTGKTGVEMEALVAVNVAALTIYDMCKAIDKNIVIKEVKLLEKTGGKSGHFRRLQV